MATVLSRSHPQCSPTDPPAPLPRSRWADRAAVGALTLGFLLLSALIAHRNLRLHSVYDLWFGADIPRHIQWAMDSGFVFRAHLHPLTFAIYKALGVALRLAQVRTRMGQFVACSLPPAFLTALAAVRAAEAFAGGDRRRFAFGLLAALSLGAPLAFAGAPESHTLGGACLLLEGVAVWRCLRDRPAPGAAFGWALAAGLMTVTNAVPAALLLLPLAARIPFPALGRRLALGACLLAFGVGLANGVEKLCREPAQIGNIVTVESAWLARPTLASTRTAFTTLVVESFGLPPMQVAVHALSWPGQPAYHLVYPRRRPGLLQTAAFALWVAGLWAWRRRAGAPSRRLVAACLAGLGFLVGFSACYDTYECYMVIDHAWPLIVLPLLIALHECRERGRIAPARCLTLCVLLCAVQCAVSLPHLLRIAARV